MFLENPFDIPKIDTDRIELIKRKFLGQAGGFVLD